MNKMEQKGLTKKQFWVQMTPNFFYAGLAAIWLSDGIERHQIWLVVAGIAYLLLVIAMVVSLIIRWKRYPIEDEEADRQATKALKDGAVGMGIIMGLITFGFLLAFGLAAILK